MPYALDCDHCQRLNLLQLAAQGGYQDVFLGNR
jgi:hypothetical protein